MNLKQLAKQIGRTFRLRPIPARISTGGEHLGPSDDEWRLDEVLTSPGRISLVNIHTGHFVQLESDNVREYRSPNIIFLRCRLTIRGTTISIEPVLSHAGDTPAVGAVIVPPGFFRYQSNGEGPGAMWVAWVWGAQTLYLPDDSTIDVRESAALPAPPTPACRTLQGSVEFQRTCHVRSAYVRNGMVQGVSDQVVIKLGATDFLQIASPPALAGYDGWLPIMGDREESLCFQMQGIGSRGSSIPFETPWQESDVRGSLVPTARTPFNLAMIGAVTSIGLNPSSVYYFYPFWDTAVESVQFAGPPESSKSLVHAQVQNRRGHIPLSVGAMQIATATPGSRVSGQTGGGNTL